MGCVGIDITRQGAVTGTVSRSGGISLHLIRQGAVTGTVSRLSGVSLQLIRQGAVTVSVMRVCQLGLLLRLCAENGLWIMTEDGNNYINLR